MAQAAEAYRRLGANGYELIEGLKQATFETRVRSAIAAGLLQRSDRRSVPADKPMPSDATLRKLCQSAGLSLEAKPVVAAVPESDTLRDQLRELRARVTAAEKSTLDSEYIKRKIIGLKESSESVDPPSWLLRPLEKSPKGQAPADVPTLFASDWHWGEVVDPKQINGVNEYNMTIAQRRARQMVERAVALLKTHLVTLHYPGIVFALGGDMVSGDIHEELSETNERPMMPALLDLMGVLTWCIRTLADEFGHVFVPAVTGNHGRTTKKPRAKGRVYTNYDWLLYQFLAKAFEGDNRIRFMIPDGPDARYAVFGHRYLLTHGDQFRGGDGMIGALGPITRGDHKKRSRNGQLDLGYDTMIMGHWHQLMMLERFIVNGSLKGYDEYADSNNFGFEIPQQALWVTHATEGITFRAPVRVDSRKRANTETDWIRWAA